MGSGTAEEKLEEELMDQEPLVLIMLGVFGAGVLGFYLTPLLSRLERVFRGATTLVVYAFGAGLFLPLRLLHGASPLKPVDALIALLLVGVVISSVGKDRGWHLRVDPHVPGGWDLALIAWCAGSLGLIRVLEPQPGSGWDVVAVLLGLLASVVAVRQGRRRNAEKR
jgi:hypothetical protein